LSDSDTYNIQSPQDEVLSAYAMIRVYAALMQTSPPHESEEYRNLLAFAKSEAAQRSIRFGMPQMPLSRSQH
jgi:hypothetical protein